MTEPIAPQAHQAIYRRWRAQTFAQVLGQDAVVETLRNAVRTNRVSHAILFVGPRGTGKTSLARILSKAINCTNLQDGDPCDACESCVSIREGRAMDLVEIDAASNRGIDAIRDLRERINYAPTDLRRKVYILDEAHQITKDAWNALLKSLEEPPDFVVFMFASTHPQEFPPAIISRLQRFDVRRLTTDEIEGKLRRILDADARTASPEAIHLIARLAGGGMRDAESMLDQLLSSSTGELDEAGVRDLLGLADVETIDGFVDALVDDDALAGIRLLDSLEDRGRDLRGFLDQVIEALRAGIVGADPKGARTNRPISHPVAALAGAARRLAAIDPSRAGVGGLRLQLELALFPDTMSPAAGARPAAGSAATPGVATEVRAPARASATATPEAPTPDAPASHSIPQPAAASPAAASPAPAPGAPTPPPKAARRTADTVSAAPPTAAPATPPGGATGDLAVLRDRWPEIVARISEHPPTKPLIVVCRPITVEDSVVTLGFPEDKAFLRQVAERRKGVLEENISAVLGRTVAVRCVATNVDVVPDLPTDEEAAWILAEARKIFGEEGETPAEVG
ncbi:MAG TPA: DNA polymerase III subunit gamma/tau [Candidatus Limnocylindrales bacterium]|nr:DNA polymerase III subunit gamma/tau [Candidatus Limnocylindrales bacterium]